MLKEDGDFAMSVEPKNGQYAYILSVRDAKKKEDATRYFEIYCSDGSKYFIEKYSFKSPVDLVDHHVKTKESLTMTSQVVLKKGVPRAQWELGHADISLTKKLGQGAFGEVHKGKLHVRKGPQAGMILDVAVKLTKMDDGKKDLRLPQRVSGFSALNQPGVPCQKAKLETLTKEQIKEIMDEARLMRLFHHPNVVEFYGVAAGAEPLMVVMELARNGALDSYLQKNTLGDEKLNEMMYQSALGLEYIHSKNIIHHDIAARNCLFGDGNVEIADFGMSREGAVFVAPPKTRAPARWLAPGTLKDAISTPKTDAWAYGILIWELFNKGALPYPGLSLLEVRQKVLGGYRMDLPSHMPATAKFVAEKCWHANANFRWSMVDVVNHLHHHGGQQRAVQIRHSSRKQKDQRTKRDRSRGPGRGATTRAIIEESGDLFCDGFPRNTIKE